MFKKYYLASVFIMISLVAFGQNDFSIGGKPLLFSQKPSSPELKISQPFLLLSPDFRKQTENDKFPPLRHQLLAPYNADDLAFFCRLEVKIEKKLNVPFKFRLGEVYYTEKMEGKY